MPRPPEPSHAERPERAVVARHVATISVVAGGDVADVLPGPAVVLGVQFRGRVVGERGLLDVAGVTGLQSGRRSYRYLDAGSVLVRFRADGAALLGVPVDALADASVGLNDLIGPDAVDALVHDVSAAQDDRARVAAVVGALAALPPIDPDRLVRRAVELIEAAAGELTVRQLAATLGVSERSLERRFKARVGAGPKRFLDLVRFARVVSAPPQRLADLAVELGYYDEAHLSRHVRRLSGLPPAALLASLAR